MKKDNTLLWVGIGSVLVVGAVLFFVLKPKGKGNKDKKDGKGDNQDLGQEITDALGTGTGTKTPPIIDPTKFKLDFDRISKILATPKTKEQKYKDMKSAGYSDGVIKIIQKADEQNDKQAMTRIIQNLQQQERDRQFERQFGVKPLSTRFTYQNPGPNTPIVTSAIK